MTAAAAIGAVAWSGTLEFIALSVFVPHLVFAQSSAKAAYAVALSYYAAANWPVIPGVYGFYGSSRTALLGVVYWSAASILQSIPWALRSRLAYPVTVFPPFGIIGWASPLTSAGVLFPGWSWFGLAALVLLPLRFLPAFALVANLIYPGNPSPPPAWAAVDTTFGKIGELREFAVSEEIQRIASQSTKSVIVFPEFVVPRWTVATEYFWEATSGELRRSGKTLLIGAGVNGNRNAVLILGADAKPPFEQRIPVPMITRDIHLNLTGPSVLDVAGERVAVLICYEQLLAWPVLHSAASRPTLIVGLANDYWAKGTPIPATQRAAVAAWARLFRLPSITAVNL